eukprot:1943204-Pyramimonas_sp.AAC.1
MQWAVLRRTRRSPWSNTLRYIVDVKASTVDVKGFVPVGTPSAAFSSGAFEYLLELVHGQESTDVVMQWDGDLSVRAVYIDVSAGNAERDVICATCVKSD